MNDYKHKKADREHGGESPWIYAVILVIILLIEMF